LAIELFGQKVSARKNYVHGTHRTVSPSETLARFLPHLQRLGITRLANVTGLDTLGIPVYVAIRPNSRSLSTSQGKGLDRDAAKASAMMESIELWHAENVDLPLRRGSYRELSANPRLRVVDPTLLPLQPGVVYDPDAVRLWVEGFDIVHARKVIVPLDVVAMDGLEPPPTFAQTSNGLASGNHVLEAIVHGVCEVIERDAEVLWRESDDVRRIDLSTVDEPYCVEVLRRIEDAGTVAAVWDMTSDIGIPAYACLLIDPPHVPRWRGVGFYIGFGCHLSRGVALARALTEAVQVRVTYVTGSRDDLFREKYNESTDPNLWSDVWKEVAEMPCTERFGDRRSLETDSFDGDLQVVSDALAAVGVEEIIVVDLTRAELDIPVVKVVVPGLEGMEGSQHGARVRRLRSASAEDTEAMRSLSCSSS
jgi:ribosomal protein S12 methylthiotransferase accessory factor